MNPNIQVGTVEGTGSAITIELGFVPDYVHIENVDGNAAATWYQGMADASMVKRTSGTFSNASSNGITPYEGTRAGNAKGFTIGADSDVNASGETLCYIAVRNGAGAQ